MIVSSGETKIFEKKLKKGVTKQGGILIVSGVEKIFSDFFLKAATQRGVVLEITSVEDESFLKKVPNGCDLLGVFWR